MNSYEHLVEAAKASAKDKTISAHEVARFNRDLAAVVKRFWPQKNREFLQIATGLPSGASAQAGSGDKPRSLAQMGNIKFLDEKKPGPTSSSQPTASAAQPVAKETVTPMDDEALKAYSEMEVEELLTIVSIEKLKEVSVQRGFAIHGEKDDIAFAEAFKQSVKDALKAAGVMDAAAGKTTEDETPSSTEDDAPKTEAKTTTSKRTSNRKRTTGKKNTPKQG